MSKSLTRLCGLLAGTAAVVVAGAAVAQEWRHGRFEEHHGTHRFGPRCLHRVAAHGFGHADFFRGHDGERKAIRRAERHWEDQVSAKFGRRYASWGRAAGKEIRCHRRGGEFECMASAHPCD